MHETQLHAASSFVTLTYSDAHLPPGGSLVKRDLQLFFKKLRKHHEKSVLVPRVDPSNPPRLRYFAVGEYGDVSERPHYHAIIFGYWPNDTVQLPGKRDLHRSPSLEKLWPQGNSSLGAVSFASASYVAHYTGKKVYGEAAAAHYGPRTPEFACMSKGLAAGWLQLYSDDVYPSDEVISSGRQAKPPRYYDKQLERTNPELHQSIKNRRVLRALQPHIAANSSSARLLVRETVATAKINLYKGSL